MYGAARIRQVLHLVKVRWHWSLLKEFNSLSLGRIQELDRALNVVVNTSVFKWSQKENTNEQLNDYFMILRITYSCNRRVFGAMFFCVAYRLHYRESESPLPLIWFSCFRTTYLHKLRRSILIIIIVSCTVLKLNYKSWIQYLLCIFVIHIFSSFQKLFLFLFMLFIPLVSYSFFIFLQYFSFSHFT